MTAFLSHSSQDKALVEDVAKQLGQHQIELDSETFDAGLLNAEAIREALKRASIFVLFLTETAIESTYVHFEALLAQELLAKGVLNRFFVVCLDEQAFTRADEHWKNYNFVRHLDSAQSISRFIQNALVANHASTHLNAQPYVERSRELNDLKRLLIQPNQSSPHALYISGNAGVGRRTFVRKFFSDRYPNINPVFAEIQVDLLDGYEEIFRKLCHEVAPMWPLRALRTRIAGFALAKDNEKAEQIARLFDQLVDNREAIFVHDSGGLLDSDGALQKPFRSIFAKMKKRPYPTIVFIARRMIPSRQRAGLDIVYSALSSLDDDQVRQLAGFLLVDSSIPYVDEDLDSIVELSDGHPFNVQFLIAKARQYTLQIALADPAELLQWKAKTGSAYLRDIAFSDEEVMVLAALRDFIVLDFDTIQRLLTGRLELTAETLTRLIDLHVVEARTDSYAVAPPLRTAVQRERRFRLPGQAQRRLLRVVSETLNVENETQPVSVSMIDAGILANLKESSSVPQHFTAFLLPSHQVWHARRYYDDRKWRECARLARDALGAVERLSPAGRVEASRLLCLASARLNDQESFGEGMSRLRSWENDSHARSNVHFLLGFNARLDGNLPKAEENFRKALQEQPGNFSAIRELASICLVRGDLEEAERCARRAHAAASDNAYVLDILVNVLVAGSDQPTEEMEYLFERLQVVGQEEGRSFYETRRAEYKLKYGSAREARALIDGAAAKTPGIFAIHALRAEIYLDAGIMSVVNEEIDRMRDLVYRVSRGERHTNLRQFLELQSSYFTAVGDYSKAKAIYERDAVFTKEEASENIRRIDHEQAIRGQ